MILISRKEAWFCHFLYTFKISFKFKLSWSHPFVLTMLTDKGNFLRASVCTGLAPCRTLSLKGMRQPMMRTPGAGPEQLLPRKLLKMSRTAWWEFWLCYLDTRKELRVQHQPTKLRYHQTILNWQAKELWKLTPHCTWWSCGFGLSEPHPCLWLERDSLHGLLPIIHPSRREL